MNCNEKVTKLAGIMNAPDTIKHSDRSAQTAQAEAIHREMNPGDSRFLDNMTDRDRQKLSIALGRAAGQRGVIKGLYTFRRNGNGFNLFKNEPK